jgi:hypothetical protein
MVIRKGEAEVMFCDLDVSGCNNFGASVKAPASGEKKKKPFPHPE